MKDLNRNYEFFSKHIVEQVEEYNKNINYEFKNKVYQSLIKQYLYYIYKFYETICSGQNYEKITKNFNSLLESNKNIKNKNEQLRRENGKLEGQLKAMINQPGLIKNQKEFVENVTVGEIEAKINETKMENRRLEEEFVKLQNWKNKQLYQMKMKHEMEGRKMMSQKAIKLALETQPSSDPEIRELKSRIRNFLDDIRFKERVKKDNPYY